MGVSAVPGSGKTYILSALAAKIIASGVLDDDQEVLIVTLVNSAVDNFSARVGKFIGDRGLLPNLGYRVRTLHGLAHDLVRERPGLVGLADDFQIIDERAAEQICTDAAAAWLRANPYKLDDYLLQNLEDGRKERVRRDELPKLLSSLAANFIRYAKDLQVGPDRLRERLDALSVPLPLAEMGATIYADYQRSLSYRAAVDFDDLIRLALNALELDEKYLLRLRQRWPYILEDEAQDSSRLQEDILRLLSGQTGNWVRVGDPNQAIYETFTTANPQYLRDFMSRPDVERRDLPNSGRSCEDIIALANELIDWIQSEHPWLEARQALTLPYIQPTPPGDPQPNPQNLPRGVILVPNRFTPAEETQAVADSLARWLPDHQESTVAVLAPRNQRGFDLANELARRQIDYVEILRSSSSTRLTAGALGNVLRYLADPQSPSRLVTLYKVWRRECRNDPFEQAWVDRLASLLRKCHHVEDFLWPRLGIDWLDSLNLTADHTLGDQARSELENFRDVVCRWHGTALLPIDQTILTLSQDLFTEPGELAVAHKLAVILRQAGNAHHDWRLPELSEELAVVARNERRFLGFSDDESGFDPGRHKGRVVIATIHKAKGLEWDRVYLMSANNYDFPSTSHDSYISERWFLRDRINLEAEAMEQLNTLYNAGPYAWYEEGTATERARLEYVSERLRLLYVGITRAKQELIITWNSGRMGEATPAVPFQALRSYLDRRAKNFQ
jgi:DNA helicase II / ATP-dependent DNA helicase PcrA